MILKTFSNFTKKPLKEEENPSAGVNAFSQSHSPSFPQKCLLDIIHIHVCASN
jgi:hypothetical protein